MAIKISKVATKLELKSQYEKPVPDALQLATDAEKELLRKHFRLVGTRKDSKYVNNLLDEYCKSLHVFYGIILEFIDEYDQESCTRNIIVENDLEKYEITIYDEAVIGDKVVAFYSKDDNENRMVFRFSMVL